MKINESTIIGQVIKEAREKQGYSQNALSRETGIPCPTICRIESGKIKKVKADFLRRFAGPLKLSYESLMVKAGYVDEVDRIINDERIEKTYLLPEEAVVELNSYIKYLKYKYNVK